VAARDRLRWPSSIAGGVVFSAILLAYSLERLRRAWIIPGDIWYVTAAAHYVQNGALGYLYSAGPHFDALALSAVLLAPVVAVGDALHLTQGYPLPVHHASMWLLLAPVTLLLPGLLVLAAGRALAWELGCRRGLWQIQVLLAVTVLLPAAVWGHFEDALALALLLEGVRRVMTGRLDGGFFLVALAICAKQWAVLAVPVLLVCVPRDRRVRAAAVALALPAALVAFPLAVDWAHASRALLFKATPIRSRVGHVSPLVHEWGVHASVLLRGAALAGSLLVAVRSRLVPARPDWPRALGAIGVCFLLRGILEPVGFAYYLGPGAAVLTLAVVAGAVRGKGPSGTGRSRVAGLAVAPVAAGAVLWSLWVHGSGWTWWLPELGCCAALVGWAAAAIGPSAAEPNVRAYHAGSATLRS
jgi:hypothetical protein